MAHIKNVIVYENKARGVLVYINQCHRNFKWYKRKKITEQYAIRRNDDTGLAHYLGGIVWSGRWRQYVFEPEEERTQWSAECLNNIRLFLLVINSKHREKLKRGKK